MKNATTSCDDYDDENGDLKLCMRHHNTTYGIVSRRRKAEEDNTQQIING
jgi:hypothetical protein